ncbi:MAG: right-handed parallel beta-helix repeat-containing protein [Candidatus Heimdallarchaeota archaeon]|nr:right-handed parallel beta-helix repeat-containing protein [Candidatus Heimdallarchaeota archaeon]MCK4291192.1 right-handed parallel beta-helix repeat-containing protein [Candidatus Heimdallarchaeota archaeon]
MPIAFHPLNVRKKTLTPHVPIVVNGDSGFTDYGFPGDGSRENPFLIEGYSIINSTDADGLVVGNTTKHFIVRNCYIEVNGDGLRVKNISNGTAVIANNQFQGCDSDAIVVVYADFTIVANNTGLEDHTGLRISYCEGVYAYNNTFVGGSPAGYICASGIYSSYCDDLILVNNSLDDFNRGIFTRDTSNSLLANNTILSSKEYGGIYLFQSSDNNLIINNTVLSNSFLDGIRLYNCDENEIAYNTIKDNNGYGCNIKTGSLYNVIHHNNFVNNGYGASQGCASSNLNTWYLSGINEGNFWSDWIGSGFYPIIGPANYDLYPLSSPAIMNWSDFPFDYIIDDIYEENDFIENAPEIPFNLLLNLIYLDTDFFRLNLNVNDFFSATIEFDETEFNLDIYLLPHNYSGSVEEILAFGEKNTSPETLNYTAHYSGIYYLWINCYDGVSTPQNYTLLITLIKNSETTTLSIYVWTIFSIVSLTNIIIIVARKLK